MPAQTNDMAPGTSGHSEYVSSLIGPTPPFFRKMSYIVFAIVASIVLLTGYFFKFPATSRFEAVIYASNQPYFIIAQTGGAFIPPGDLKVKQGDSVKLTEGSSTHIFIAPFDGVIEAVLIPGSISSPGDTIACILPHVNQYSALAVIPFKSVPFFKEQRAVTLRLPDNSKINGMAALQPSWKNGNDYKIAISFDSSQQIALAAKAAFYKLKVNAEVKMSEKSILSLLYDKNIR